MKRAGYKVGLPVLFSALSSLQIVWLFLRVTYYAIYALCVFFHPPYLDSLLATYRPPGAFKQDNSLCLWLRTKKAFICIFLFLFFSSPFIFLPSSILFILNLLYSNTDFYLLHLYPFLLLQFLTALPCNINYKIN